MTTSEEPIIERFKSYLTNNEDFAEEYQKFLSENLKPLKLLMANYRCAMMEIETKFRVLNEEFSLDHERSPIENIQTRLKSIGSISSKLKRRNLPMTIESLEQNLNDVAGVRIICSFPEDIYLLCDCLLRQDDIRLVERKDYIKDPKPNGYRSLHLIVEVPIFLKDGKRWMKVEVQMRTIAMDFWATLEHKLRYKKGLPEQMLLELSSELSECAEISASLDQRMQDIRNRIEQEDNNLP